jgi:uncharacterized lipoprotein YajG
MFSRLHHFALAVLLLVASVALCGCQALGQAMGMTPSAQAPAVNVIQSNASGSADASGAGRSARTDQSGDVGASGQASQTATQTLEIPQEMIDLLVNAAQKALAAGNPAAASAILDGLKTAETKAPPPPAAAPPK